MKWHKLYKRRIKHFMELPIEHKQRLLILQRSMVLKKSMMKLMMCLMMKMLILFIWQHHIIRIINL